MDDVFRIVRWLRSKQRISIGITSLPINVLENIRSIAREAHIAEARNKVARTNMKEEDEDEWEDEDEDEDEEGEDLGDIYEVRRVPYFD